MHNSLVLHQNPSEQKLLYLNILNWRSPPIDHIHSFRHNIDRGYLMALRQQSSDAQPHIIRSCNRYFYYKFLDSDSIKDFHLKYPNTAMTT